MLHIQNLHYALYTRNFQDALGASGLVFCIFRISVTERQSIYRMASFNELFEGFIDTSLTMGPITLRRRLINGSPKRLRIRACRLLDAGIRLGCP